MCRTLLLRKQFCKDISDDLKHVFTTDYIVDNFPVFNEQLAYQILSVIIHGY